MSDSVQDAIKFIPPPRPVSGYFFRQLRLLGIYTIFVLIFLPIIFLTVGERANEQQEMQSIFNQGKCLTGKVVDSFVTEGKYVIGYLYYQALISGEMRNSREVYWENNAIARLKNLRPGNDIKVCYDPINPSHMVSELEYYFAYSPWWRVGLIASVLFFVVPWIVMLGEIIIRSLRIRYGQVVFVDILSRNGRVLEAGYASGGRQLKKRIKIPRLAAESYLDWRNWQGDPREAPPAPPWGDFPVLPCYRTGFKVVEPDELSYVLKRT